MIQTMETRLHVRVEYSIEGGDSKALHLYAKGATRELTYEAMDEVLKADISQAELVAVEALLEKISIIPDRVFCELSDAITLSYQCADGQWMVSVGEKGSSKFDVLFEVWTALSEISTRYFIPRF